MKKIVLSIFTICISLVSSAQNILEGGIFQDITLTADQSPYIVVADIAIYPSV